MFKARIKADSLKEFIGTVGSLVDEAKLNVNEDGIQIKAVDPSHVAMIETNLVKSAFCLVCQFSFSLTKSQINN